MKQENIYTSTQVEEILKDEFKKFEKKHGVTNGSDELAQYIEQVKETINKPQVNLA